MSGLHVASEMSAVLTHPKTTALRPHWLVGAGGFEPPYGGIKIRSPSSRLTSSRQPIVELRGRGSAQTFPCDQIASG